MLRLLSIKDTHYYTVEESAVMCPVIVNKIFEIQRFNSIILSVFCIISKDTNHYWGICAVMYMWIYFTPGILNTYYQVMDSNGTAEI